jgi:L-proline amide hydrolase
MEKDPTVYLAMNGPSEFYVVGNLKDWDIQARLKEIDVPTLLVSGRYDEATPRIQEVMMAGIPDVEWAFFEESSHLPHIEEHEGWLEAVGAFLGKLDAKESARR